MFPYKDDNPAELTPITTIGLIVLNVAAWLFIQGMGTQLEGSVCQFGMVPAELTGQGPEGPTICPLEEGQWLTVFSSMFMHGGWFHLIANMMFLWVFGNNVEDSMGHLRFIVFYLLAGVAGAAGHILLNPASGVPTVGASGAISGVLGGYLLLYPRVTISVLFPPFWVLRLPAFVVLGYWIVLQILMGLAQIGGGYGAGIAVWAHIGGFFAGLLLVKLFDREPLVAAKRQKRKLSPSEIREHHWNW